MFRSSDLYLVPFSLLWGGFAVFWNVSVWTMGAPWFFRLWGLPFLVAGLYFVLGRFLHEAWLRDHIFYAISDRRVLVFRTGPWPRLRSAEIGYLPVFEYEEHRDGRGSLNFDIDDEESSSWWLRGRRQAPWITPLSRLRFDRIEQPREVYDLIRRETDRWHRNRYGESSEPRSFIG